MAKGVMHKGMAINTVAEATATAERFVITLYLRRDFPTVHIIRPLATSWLRDKLIQVVQERNQTETH
jgi:hypothetical protein